MILTVHDELLFEVPGGRGGAVRRHRARPDAVGGGPDGAAGRGRRHRAELEGGQGLTNGLNKPEHKRLNWYNARRWPSRGSSRAPSTRSRAATSIPTRSRFSIGCASSTTSPTSSAAASATCCSAAGRRISTSARRRIRYQVKKLFRNCWIIGRRFRLAHVKFGTKVIEVATFRRQVAPGEEVVADGVPAPDPTTPDGRALDSPRQHVRHARGGRVPPRLHDQRAVLRHRDLLDHRLRRRPRGSQRRASCDRSAIRKMRFQEDPVRMLRAVALAARLDFTIDPPRRSTPSARHRHEIARSSPPRLLEEYYKILRAGCGGADVPRASLEIGPARADLGRAPPAGRRRAVASRSARSTPIAAGSSRRRRR